MLMLFNLFLDLLKNLHSLFQVALLLFLLHLLLFIILMLFVNGVVKLPCDTFHERSQYHDNNLMGQDEEEHCCSKCSITISMIKSDSWPTDSCKHLNKNIVSTKQSIEIGVLLVTPIRTLRWRYFWYVSKYLQAKYPQEVKRDHVQREELEDDGNNYCYLIHQFRELCEDQTSQWNL